MFELNTLRARLQPHLGWHGARILFVAVFIMALFRARTVNLSELSVAFPGRAKPASYYKRQQRFFRAFKLDYAVVAQLVVEWHFCWAVKVGQWLHEAKPLVVKAHGRLAKSFFRCGFDHLRHIFMNLTQSQEQRDFQLVVHFLSCT